MKNIRQNFVVEYKTSRRQVKTRPNSIWGDMDLKALVREVESDLPKTVSAANEDPAPDRATSQPVQEGDVVVRPDPEGALEPPPTGHSSDVVEDQCGASIEAKVTSVTERLAPSVISSAGSTPDAKLVRHRQHRIQPVETPHLPHHDHDDLASLSEDHSDPGAQLKALEAENRRLKRLMVIKLRAENDRLRSMLTRFRTA